MNNKVPNNNQSSTTEQNLPLRILSKVKNKPKHN